MDIAKTIKALRAQAHLTQRQIADELGCTQPNVSYLEKTTAERSRPSNSVVEGLRRLSKTHAINV